MKNSFVLLIVFGLLIGCKEKQEPTPNVNSKLQITGIQFPGIPDKDVTIDQLKRVIYVKMPSLLKVDNLSPTVVLSDDAKLTIPNDIISVGQVHHWCYPGENLFIRLSKKERTNEVEDATYIILPIAPAPTNVVQQKPLPLFALGDSANIYIDVENVYGNKLPKSAIFTNKKTGNQLTINGNMPAYPYLNKIKLFAYPLPLELGDYEIGLLMPEGNILKIPQTLTVVKGSSVLYHDWAVMNVVAGKNLAVTGHNLFDGTTSFRLLYPNGSTLPLTATYSSIGKNATLAIPSTLTPGYYGLEIVRDSRPLGISYRVSVVRDEHQPFIFTLNGLPFQSYPTIEPLILTRNQRIPVLFRRRKLDGYVLTFINELNSKSLFQFALTYPTEANPYFIIPSEVPAGKYKVYIQEIDPVTKEVMQQSEPFERVVVLQ